MISAKEHEHLYQFLGLREETVEKVVEKFTKQFGSEYYSLFRISFTLSNLLRLNLLTKVQRLLTLFLLVEFYKAEGIKKNPFGGIILEIHNNAVDQFQRKFIAELLLDNKRDKYAKMKVDVLAEESDMFQELYRQREEIDALEKGWIANAPKIFLPQSNQVYNTISDFNSKERRHDPPESALAKQAVKEQQINTESFSANFLRPLPAFKEVEHSQFVWLSPGMVHDVVWDNSYQKPNKVSRVKALLSKTQNSPMIMDQVMELFKILDQYPYIFWNQINPNSIEQMANKNPYTTAQIFVRLYGHPKFQTFLDKLLKTNVNTNTIHVMTMFLGKCLLPSALVEFYVNNTMGQCVQMDTNSQTQKLANLAAAFAKKSIELKWIDGKQVEQNTKRLLEKFPKNETISQVVKSFS